MTRLAVSLLFLLTASRAQAASAPSGPSRAIVLDEEMRERLRALGYLYPS